MGNYYVVKAGNQWALKSRKDRYYSAKYNNKATALKVAKRWNRR